MRDIDEFLEPTLVLPMGGKEYTIKSPDSALGVRIARMWTTGLAAVNGVEISAKDLEGLVLDDTDARDLYQRLLGDAFAEMEADGIRWHWIRHAGVTALFWVAVDRVAAERYWESPGELLPAGNQNPPKSEPSSDQSSPEPETPSEDPEH